MSPPTVSDKHGSSKAASQPASQPLFIPITAVAGKNGIVITPAPVAAPRLDSRDEQRNATVDSAVEEPRSTSKAIKFRRHSPPAALPWPVLRVERNPDAYSLRSTVDMRVAIPIKKKAQHQSSVANPKPDQIHHRVSAARRIYEQSAGTSTASAQQKAKRTRERTPPVLDPLDRLKLRVTQQQATLTEAVESRIDSASRVVPIQFLRDHEQHHAFAERVVLLSMARVLQRHYHRVKRAAWMEWKKHTLTRRILEDHERKLFILKQSSLAHACGIIQRHVMARMRAIWTRWARVTERLRFIEHTRSACRIQKCWRAWNMQHKLKTLALLYRERVRNASARVIQSTIRRYLARCEMARIVWLHRRHSAAVLIQKTYRNYVIRQIAMRHRQLVAASLIQRAWRGFMGRMRVHARRVSCRLAVEQFLAGRRWESEATEIVIKKHTSASRIQRCILTFVYRQTVMRGLRRSRDRRRMMPVYRIQNAWRVYRVCQLRQVIDMVVFRVVMARVSAVRRIQHCFRQYWHRKVDNASRLISKLLRKFYAKRLVMYGRILPWLIEWRTRRLNHWSTVCLGSTTKWRHTLSWWRKRLDEFAHDQALVCRRLNVCVGVRLILECKSFESSFQTTRASEIQRTWRWHRLRVLVFQLRQAATVLRRAVPLRFRHYKKRKQRQRVLQRWKRQRFIELRSRFDQWKMQHLLLVQARDLSTSTRKLRKALWFHHHKLRKQMMQRWSAHVLQRRHKRAKINSAITHDKLTKQRHCWHAWRHEALPQLCCINTLNVIKVTLTVWKTWTSYVQRKKKSQRARLHHQCLLKTSALAAWQQDRLDYFEELRGADVFWTKYTIKHAFNALSRYVTKMKQVRAFSREKQQVYALRHWLERVYDTKNDHERKRQAILLREKLLKQAMWRQWHKYVVHQSAQRLTLEKMDRQYKERRLRGVMKTWSRELVPMWKDYRLIESIAAMYRARRLKEYYFRQGLAQFWAVTAGARRIQMAIRIQRAFRGKRARHKVFVLRMKVQYQLEARFSTGVDVQKLTATLLQNMLPSREWVFVLFSFPWIPVDARVNKAFYKTATTWTYLRNQASRMAFGVADANQMMNEPAHEFSFMSWFDLQPTQLPCVVAFWRGVGPPVNSAAEPTSRLANGETRKLKRRFKAVCSSSLIYNWPAPGQTSDHIQPATMSQLVVWIEGLQSTAIEATVVDIQSFIRGFLARRHTKRRRVLKKQRQIQRIRAWTRALIDKWEHNKRDAAASKIQRWIRQIFVRRAFWKSFQSAMGIAKRALSRLQRAVRLRLSRKRLRIALIALLATCDRYPNAPLCQECFHVTHSLARLQCRDCQQAYCATCFDKTHKAGKRLLHLCDSIDFVSMNGEDSKQCTHCDVRGAVRYCHTCSSDERSTNGQWMCLACFEDTHTDERGRGEVKQSRRVPWWSSRLFQTHEWVRIRSPDDSAAATLTASVVMQKYGWQSKNQVLRKLQEAAQVEESLHEREERLLAIRLQNEAILRDAFDRFDTDKSGAIDRSEFKRMFKEELCEPLSDEQVDEAMKCMDKSGNGLIEFDELLAWFAEEALTKAEKGGEEAGDPRSLVMLKEALKAKRQMRRYKEKLHEFVPSVSLNVIDQPKRVVADALAHLTERRQKKKTVPGFPSVKCLEHGDFARKRKVFFRFMHEICGLDWIYEDEGTIPVTNSMEVFDLVFVPRWNAGELTYDFYFDDESFEFEGELWQRRWDATAKRYIFTTTRRKTRTVLETPSGDRTSNLGRKSRKRLAKHRADGGPKTVEIEENVEIVEAIDPRRKQMLLEDAQAAFHKADVDGSGFIDENEFHRMLTLELCEPVSKSKARQILKQLDADGSGKIDFHEFFQWYAVDKCQDYPLSSQMERAKALLKTRRRAKETVASAVHVSASTGRLLKDAIDRKRKERQLMNDCKGASPELITLLQEGHEKRLAEKALALHNQDVAFARHWLESKKRGEREEKEVAAREKADRKAQAKKDKRLKQQKRRQKMKATRLYLKNLLIGPSKKEAHTARVQQALTNLDREILMVEQRLNGQDQY